MNNEEMYSDNSYNNDLSPTPWERKYALFPTKVNDIWVWCDYYYRRMVWSVYKAGEFHTDHEWRYQFGTLLDVLKV